MRGAHWWLEFRRWRFRSQVNLRYHPDACASLETAFDPEANAAYAADFLVRLREEARSWTRAIGQYHSRQAIRGNGYRAKVFKAWREARHRANRARQEAVRAAREAGRDSASWNDRSEEQRRRREGVRTGRSGGC